MKTTLATWREKVMTAPMTIKRSTPKRLASHGKRNIVGTSSVAAMAHVQPTTLPGAPRLPQIDREERGLRGDGRPGHQRADKEEGDWAMAQDGAGGLAEAGRAHGIGRGGSAIAETPTRARAGTMTKNMAPMPPRSTSRPTIGAKTMKLADPQARIQP